MEQVKKQYTRCGAFLLHCNGMAKERKKMVRLMNEVMEGWQEMEGKDGVVRVVNKGVRMDGYERKWRGCIESDWIE